LRLVLNQLAPHLSRDWQRAVFPLIQMNSGKVLLRCRHEHSSCQSMELQIALDPTVVELHLFRNEYDSLLQSPLRIRVEVRQVPGGGLILDEGGLDHTVLSNHGGGDERN
jgi:hypothetical protein